MLLLSIFVVLARPLAYLIAVQYLILKGCLLPLPVTWTAVCYNDFQLSH